MKLKKIMWYMKFDLYFEFNKVTKGFKIMQCFKIFQKFSKKNHGWGGGNFEAQHW